MPISNAMVAVRRIAVSVRFVMLSPKRCCAWSQPREVSTRQSAVSRVALGDRRQGLLACQNRCHVANREIRHGGARLNGAAAQMRHEHDAFTRQQFGSQHRLLLAYVEG